MKPQCIRAAIIGVLAIAHAVAGETLSAQSQTGSAEVDTSAHKVRLVRVAPEVALEVLDWGGAGVPIVFVPGLGMTAHSFDDFAPRFRDRYHVIGITRRGAGASSIPADGYDADRRALDVVAVLDSLRIDSAILVGHSFGADELSKLAADHARRVSALIYLDAYDYGSSYPAAPDTLKLPKSALMTRADSSSVAAVSAYWLRVAGLRLPAGEVRSMHSFDRDGRLKADSIATARERATQQALAGGQAAQYSKITAPALGVYATIRSPADVFALYETMGPDDQLVASAIVQHSTAFTDGVKRRFRTELRNSSVIEISGANHFIFQSHPSEVESAMRTFLGRVLAR